MGPDLANFHQFCKILNIFVNLIRVYSVIGKVLNLISVIFLLLWKIFIVVKNQILKIIIKQSSHTGNGLLISNLNVVSIILKRLSIALCGIKQFIYYPGHVSGVFIFNTVWPDVGWKSCPNFSNVAQKVAT